MTIYQCYRCGYESHIKTIIVRHINRKNICKPKVNNIKGNKLNVNKLKGNKLNTRKANNIVLETI